MPAITKGTLEPGSAVSNLYELKLDGLIPIRFTSVGSISQSTKQAKLPDQTWVSTGQKEPIEIDVKWMVHHATERAAMNAWFRETEAGTLTSKKRGTLKLLNGSGGTICAFQIIGASCSGWTLPDLAAGEDGSAVEMTSKLAIDDVQPL